MHSAETIIVRLETPSDQHAIREVNRLAFGRDDEAGLVNSLRDGGFIRLSLVAQVHRAIVGHILFSELAIISDMGTIPALALAPLAVVPECQRHGIGSQLVRHGLAACREQGHRIVIVLGHPHFYPRFGFSAELARRLDSPYSGEAFMAIELVENALQRISGRVQYPAPFESP
jgi:putative acetyltransferase